MWVGRAINQLLRQPGRLFELAFVERKLDQVLLQFFNAGQVDRSGLEWYRVESDVGMMGGSGAHEYMAPCEAGENDVALASGYAANVKSMHGKGFALRGNAAEYLDQVFSSGDTIPMRWSEAAVPPLSIRRICWSIFSSIRRISSSLSSSD